MDKMLFIAMNGAGQAMRSQANIAHNLANVSTTGFKASLDAYSNWHVAGPGLPTRVYNQWQQTGSDMSSGSFITTGRELDVAVRGEGWLAVQGNNGQEAYTRAGDLRLNELGQLTNGVGHVVIGNSGPIVVPPAQKIEIAVDGSISVLPVGQTADSMAVVDRIKLVKPDLNQLSKGEDGLMYQAGGEKAKPSAEVKLASGVLETSNVNAVSELVEMIGNARQYEINVKMMQTADQVAKSAEQLLRA
ncbi:MAG TPA: flagellar basal body rod protein FlgF [Gammaproteobacteria bacterium]|nr:flagellar basal body rod protein FlgF [Gammaproteobacteria bacterium]